MSSYPSWSLRFNTFDLTKAESEALEKRWITRELAIDAGIRRVDDVEGARIIGREGKVGNYAGIVIPNVLPGTDQMCRLRLRRDNPDIDAKGKPHGKYMGAPAISPSEYYVESWCPGTATSVIGREAESTAPTEKHEPSLRRWLRERTPMDVGLFVFQRINSFGSVGASSVNEGAVV